VAQAVECQLCKCKALRSNPSPPKTKQKTKKNLTGIALLGQKYISILGSTEAESSDDSLVDLVSAEHWSIAELPKHCFYHELVFPRNAVFGRESHVTFYEIDLLLPRQLPFAKS
jgi:hypothetical protein